MINYSLCLQCPPRIFNLSASFVHTQVRFKLVYVFRICQVSFTLFALNGKWGPSVSQLSDSQVAQATCCCPLTVVSSTNGISSIS